jgi:hypothetical protein
MALNRCRNNRCAEGSCSDRPLAFTTSALPLIQNRSSKRKLRNVRSVRTPPFWVGDYTFADVAIGKLCIRLQVPKPRVDPLLASTPEGCANFLMARTPSSLPGNISGAALSSWPSRGGNTPTDTHSEADPRLVSKPKNWVLGNALVFILRRTTRGHLHRSRVEFCAPPLWCNTSP